MSDIAFLLIVFFMSTTKFDVKEGIRIVLPQAADESSQETQVLTLTEKRDDTYADYERRSHFGEQRNSAQIRKRRIGCLDSAKTKDKLRYDLQDYHRS